MNKGITVDTYFKTEVFQVKFWNHFSTNSETTDNFVEGNNTK